MKKSLLNLGRTLNRNEQKQINGGGLELEIDNCFAHTTSASCGTKRGCKWYNGCYCGPLAPHFAPC